MDETQCYRHSARLDPIELLSREVQNSREGRIPERNSSRSGDDLNQNFRN